MCGDDSTEATKDGIQDNILVVKVVTAKWKLREAKVSEKLVVWVEVNKQGGGGKSIHPALIQVHT